jgi:quinol monooxygenase YgiN
MIHESNELDRDTRVEIPLVRIEHWAISMIVGTLRILPLPDRRLQVLEILRSVQGPLLAQPGCAGCHIYAELGSEPAIVFVERWQSEAALTLHIRSEAYRRILGACEFSGAPPEFRFDKVSNTQGIELIEQSLRTGG